MKVVGIQTTERTQDFGIYRVGVDNRHIRGQGVSASGYFWTGCIVITTANGV